MDFYADTYFLGQWGHKNPQDPICDSSRTGSVTTFAIFPLLWVTKLQTYISIYILHYEYVALSHSVRSLLPMKSLIKEVIDNLGIESEKLKFVSISIIYEDNNGAIVVATSYHKFSSNPSTNRVLRIFMSLQSRKICISITTHHQFVGFIKH